MQVFNVTIYFLGFDIKIILHTSSLPGLICITYSLKFILVILLGKLPLLSYHTSRKNLSPTLYVTFDRNIKISLAGVLVDLWQVLWVFVRLPVFFEIFVVLLRKRLDFLSSANLFFFSIILLHRLIRSFIDEVALHNSQFTEFHLHVTTIDFKLRLLFLKLHIILMKILVNLCKVWIVRIILFTVFSTSLLGEANIWIISTQENHFIFQLFNSVLV